MTSSDLSIPFATASEVLAAAIVLPIVGGLLIVLRFYLRIKNKIRLKSDDYLTVSAWLFVTGMGVVLIYGVAAKSIGYPTPKFLDSTPEDQLSEISSKQRRVELIDWTIWVLMIPGNGLIKLSFLCFYRRLFVIHKGSIFDITTVVLIIVVVLWMVAFWFATIFGCGHHIDYSWETLAKLSSCHDHNRLDGLMISDLITDVIVWALPIFPLWKLQMTTWKKVRVTFIFLLGVISLAAAIVRLIVQVEISNGGYTAHTDIDLTITLLVYWSMIESGLALIAASLPSLYKVVVSIPFKDYSSTMHNVARQALHKYRRTSSQDVKSHIECKDAT